MIDLRSAASLRGASYPILYVHDSLARKDNFITVCFNRNACNQPFVVPAERHQSSLERDENATPPARRGAPVPSRRAAFHFTAPSSPSMC